MGFYFVLFCFLHNRNLKDLYPLSYLDWDFKAAEISDVTSKAM